jgi:hypothetical protein
MMNQCMAIEDSEGVGKYLTVDSEMMHLDGQSCFDLWPCVKIMTACMLWLHIYLYGVIFVVWLSHGPCSTEASELLH